MEPGIAVALISAVGAVIAAALAGRKTRKTRPELADTQVGYLTKINDRLNAEVERLEEDLAEERKKSCAQDAQILDLTRRVHQLEERLETAINALARRGLR